MAMSLQVLLQLGPGSTAQPGPQKPGTLTNSVGKRVAGVPVTQQRTSPYKENIPYMEMPYGSLSRGAKQNGEGMKGGYPNGMTMAGHPTDHPTT